jgi:copper transport protein
VALTSVLVDAAPSVAEATRPAALSAFTKTERVGNDWLSASLYPLVPGPVGVGLQLTDKDTVPIDPFQIYAQLRLASRQIGPISVPLTRLTTGRWSASGVELPLAGQWQLTVGVLTSPTNEIDVTMQVPVASP